MTRRLIGVRPVSATNRLTEGSLNSTTGLILERSIFHQTTLRPTDRESPPSKSKATRNLGFPSSRRHEMQCIGDFLYRFRVSSFLLSGIFDRS